MDNQVFFKCGYSCLFNISYAVLSSQKYPTLKRIGVLLSAFFCRKTNDQWKLFNVTSLSSKFLNYLVIMPSEAFILFSSLDRLFGDSWQSVQQVLKRHRWLWGHVLWTRLRHHARQTCYQVWMQVQVVLRSGVQRLWGRSGHSHLQTAQETWLVGHNLAKRQGQKQPQ